MNDFIKKYADIFIIIFLVGIYDLNLYINRRPTGCFDVCVFSPIIVMPFTWSGGIVTIISIFILRKIKLKYRIFISLFLLWALTFLSFFIYLQLGKPL